MSNLVAVVFEDEATAFEMRAALVKMQKEYLIEIEDAVVVTRDQKGKTRLDQAVNLTTAGAVGGGFWGMLIGLIFLNPLLGAAINGLFGRRFRFSERVVGSVGVGSVALAFLISVSAVVSYGTGVWPKPYVTAIASTEPWGKAAWARYTWRRT